MIYEISLVGVGADSNALTDTEHVKEFKTVVPYQDLPLADEGTQWSGSGARNNIKKWAGAEEGLTTSAIKAKYRKGFLWFDTENDDTFGAYKLPIANVFDGTLKAVPKGIFSAAGAVQGARTPVSIPENEISGVKTNLNKYYKKMDKESPFEKSVFRLDYLSLDERILEHLLKSGVRFSNKHAKKLVTLIKNGYRDDSDSVDQWDADDWGKLM
ncbi:MAG: hypothetical protein GY834_15615, partial [Bacteroidetes bacterium]|nr:hypothetical protein [Bacteroidota bacterium]